MGFDEQEVVVQRITANKDFWLKFMIQDEIGISPGFIDNPFEIIFYFSRFLYYRCNTGITTISLV